MEKRPISAFEYAIMQAAHEANPLSVTKDDLDKVRPLTRDEELQRREENLRRQAERIRIKIH